MKEKHMKNISVARMRGSGLTLEGLYEYLAIIRGYDISRAMLLRILWRRRTPSPELYEEIDGALSLAEQVRNRRLFPLSDESEG